MIDLEFLGPAGDGESLVFTDQGGERYRVAASGELRAEIARLLIRGSDSSSQERPASPGQIQALLRSGLSPAEVAEQSGSDVERVLRYYAPVEAEINRAIRLAQAGRVGVEVDSPTMGDLVIDRLAAKGIDIQEIAWSAAKESDGDWVTILSFPENGVIQTARWSSSANTGRVVALDPVAQELTETTQPSSPMNSLFPPAPLLPRKADERQQATSDEVSIPVTPRLDRVSASEDQARAEELVEKLNQARGKRVPIMDDMLDLELDDADVGDEDSEQQSTGVSLRSVTDPANQQSTATTQTTGTDDPASEKSTEPPVDTAPQPSGSKRGKRTPVPSWDEIVFGQRPE